VIFVLATSALVAFSVPQDRYFDIAKPDIFATLVKEVNANYG